MPTVKPRWGPDTACERAWSCAWTALPTGWFVARHSDLQPSGIWGKWDLSHCLVRINSPLSKHLYSLISGDVKKVGTTIESSLNYPVMRNSHRIKQEEANGNAGWQAAVSQRFQQSSGSLTGAHTGQIVSFISIPRQPITGTHLHLCLSVFPTAC